MNTTRLVPRQLAAFAAVAELGSFRRAAARLHLSSSAVSNLINEIEAGIGFQLFHRTTRAVALSPKGREFLPSALAVLRELDAAAKAAAELRNRESEVVRIAAPMAVASAILPRLIAAYRRDHPNLHIHIVDTPVESLADRVMTADADLASGPDRIPPHGVICRKLFPSPWVLWCSPQHPLAMQPVIQWNDLRDVDLCAAGRDHEQSVDQMNPELPIEQRITPAEIVDNISTALGLAATACYVTCAPAYVESLARPLGLQMRRIVAPEVTRYVSLYAPSERNESDAARRFSKFLQEQLIQPRGGAAYSS